MKFLQPFSTRLLFGVFLLLGLVWIWSSAVPAGATTTNDRIPAPQTGFLAPDFTLKTLEGQTIKLSDLRGKVVLINIWASWCPPCKAEMPAIENAYQVYKNKGLVVLAINSTVQDVLADAQAFVQTNRLTFPILLDDNGLVTRLYRVQALPSSYFIGADGIIREVVIGGPMSEALLLSHIENLLSEAH